MSYIKEKLEQFITKHEGSKNTKSVGNNNYIPIYNVSKNFIDNKFRELLKENNEFYILKISEDDFMNITKLHIINKDELINAEYKIRELLSILSDRIENLIDNQDKIELLLEKIEDNIKIFSDIDLFIEEKILTRNKDKILIECNIINSDVCPICGYISMINYILRNPDTAFEQNVVNLSDITDEEDLEHIITNKDVSVFDMVRLNIIMEILNILSSNILTIYKYNFYIINSNKRNAFILSLDKHYFNILSEKVLNEMVNNEISSIHEIDCIKMLVQDNSNDISFSLYISNHDECNQFKGLHDELTIKNTIIKSNRRNISKDSIVLFYENFEKYISSIIRILTEDILEL